MNRKGQVLILFVLLLPVLLLFAGIVIDTGISYIEKRKIENVMKDTISYALDHLEEESQTLKINMGHIMNENIKDIYDMKIEIGNQYIQLQVEKKITTIFGIMTTPNKTIKLSYRGNLINGKKNIERK